MVKIARRPRPAAADVQKTEADTQSHARAAGLRYVTDETPGLTRHKAGRGWSYRDAGGKVVRDRATLDRICALAIPPAYTDVWICPAASGHIQATGRDARGRKQYRYHEKWRATRDEKKFDRMVAFSAALPRIRDKVRRDLQGSEVTGQRVLAAAVRILETTGMRVGNDEYARTNRSYGLTTLRDRHVSFSNGGAQFEYRGKSGKWHSVAIDDKRLARIIRSCRDIPGATLFQYYDDAGQRQSIDSGEVNDYLREASGDDFSAKDFRTWAGTTLAAVWLRDVERPDTERERKSVLVQATDHVAERLNNTRAVCRKYYIHPAIFESWSAGSLAELLARGARRGRKGLTKDERAVLGVLQ